MFCVQQRMPCVERWTVASTTAASTFVAQWMKPRAE